MFRPSVVLLSAFFFFNDTATTEIYTLSLHDALPISVGHAVAVSVVEAQEIRGRPDKETSAIPQRPHGHADLVGEHFAAVEKDRKSTRLNSSHGYISYAVFCLKKKKTS